MSEINPIRRDGCLASIDGVLVRGLEQGKATLRMDKDNQVLDLFSAELGPVPIDRSVYA